MPPAFLPARFDGQSPPGGVLMSRAWLTATCLILTGSVGVRLRAQETTQTVAAISADGRILRGVLDARSDDDHLWLRTEEGAAVLTTSLAWLDVVEATLNGEAVNPADLRRRAAARASRGPMLSALLQASPPVILSHATPRRPRRVYVRNIEIVDACLVNLDRDVEPDGLTVSIAAIGDDGTPLAVRGSLQARLFGERRPADSSIDVFEQLHDWTQPVAATDFVDGVATYELRFRKTAPEWEFDLLPDAVLDVRLGAFGHGNYAASSPVLVRAFNPLRDNLQLRGRTRFLPHELHGRNPSSTPQYRDGLWFNWWW
jgi:hypothetical protein